MDKEMRDFFDFDFGAFEQLTVADFDSFVAADDERCKRARKLRVSALDRQVSQRFADDYQKSELLRRMEHNRRAKVLGIPSDFDERESIIDISSITDDNEDVMLHAEKTEEIAVDQLDSYEKTAVFLQLCKLLITDHCLSRRLLTSPDLLAQREQVVGRRLLALR